MQLFRKSVAAPHTPLPVSCLNCRKLLKFGSSVFHLEKEIIREDVKIAVLADEAAIDAAVVRIAYTVQLLRIIYRQRAQQNSLNQRENSSIGPDAKRQSDNGRQRETWRLAQLSQRVTNVLNRVREEEIHRICTPLLNLGPQASR